MSGGFSSSVPFKSTTNPYTYTVQKISRQYPSPWIGCTPPPIIQYAKPTIGFLAPTSRPQDATPDNPYYINADNILSDTAPLEGPPTVVFPVWDNDAFPTDQSQGFWTQAKQFLAQ